MSQTETICRPGGFSLTDQLIGYAAKHRRRFQDGTDSLSADSPSADSLSEDSLSLADIGCGEGASLRYLAAKHPGWELHGVDRRPAVCRSLPVRKGRAEKLPFPDRSQDIVLMECSLSRFEDPDRALREALRVLKEDGILLVSDLYSRLAEEDAREYTREFNREYAGECAWECARTSGRLAVGRVETASRIRRRLEDAGFHLLEMQDVSRVLGTWTGQMILDGRGCEIPELLGADPAELKKRKCGYYLLAAEPSPLGETLRYARQNAEWYRGHWPEIPEERLSAAELFGELPFCSAEDLIRNPYDFLCVSPNRIARIITLKSSGSAGAAKRIFFTEDDLERTVDFFTWGIRYVVQPGERAAIFMEGPAHASVGGLLTDAIQCVPAEAVTCGLIRDFAEAAVCAEGCEVLVGLPSQMYELAARYPRLSPRAVLLSAEYAADSVKQFLADTWGCKVFEHWGMSETGYGGGVECGAGGGYHLRDDLMVEVIDPETGRPVPDGGEGEIVITTLRRRGMPLIRYRTGDIGSLRTDPCGCGCLLPRLGRIRRRITSAGTAGPAEHTAAGRRIGIPELDEILYGIPGIFAYQAETDRSGARLSVHLLTDETADAEEREKICGAARLALAHEFGFPAAADTHFEREPTGSAKRKIRITDEESASQSEDPV